MTETHEHGKVISFPGLQLSGVDDEPDPGEDLAAEVERRMTAVSSVVAEPDTQEETDTENAEPLTAVWESTPERQIIPSWLLDPEELRRRLVWQAKWAGHVLAFHAVRLPLYGGRLALRSPIGFWCVFRVWLGWVSDRETRVLRRHAADGQDIPAYVVLQRQAKPRMKERLLLSMWAGLAGLVAWLLVWWRLWPSWMLLSYPVTTVLVLVLVAGWKGRRPDQPIMDTPLTLSSGPRKLTPDMIAEAFIAAGLAKDTRPIGFVEPVSRDGEGWRACVDLPPGTKASSALRKREELAAALDVDEARVFLNRVRGQGGSARRVVLWVADSDPYALKPPVTPMNRLESIDFWNGFPFGLDARKRPVHLKLVWSSMLVGAVPRMGKTFAARLPAAAAALDPHVRLHVYDGKGGKDWQPFVTVSHRYGSGVRDAVVNALVDDLQDLVEDMNRRYEIFRQLPNDLCPEGKLTPRLARDRERNLPLVLLCIDEVQRYLEHDRGPEILELLVELVKVGPAAGIMLVLATQRPDAKTLPESLRGQIGTRFALKVMNWQASDTILGAGSYPDLDASALLRSHKGVGILLGADDGELAEEGGRIVRTHLMDIPALQTIINTAAALRTNAGTLTGVATGEDPIENVTARRNILDDTLDVFQADEDRLWTEHLLSRLAEAWPEEYDGWEQTDLANALRPWGVRPGQVWGQTDEGRGANRRGVTRQALLDALHTREQTPRKGR